MPDVTVSADVDSMLRSANDAAIRSAIGVGQTDPVTFLAQTLTGQSLTGTQATSLVDLSATWNTTGNPSLIYGRVTNTNSGTTANLIDLGTLAGGSLFKVDKTGVLTVAASPDYNVATALRFPAGNHGISFSSGDLTTIVSGGVGVASFKGNAGVLIKSTLPLAWSTADVNGAAGVSLYRDANGILAQRDGTAAQAFRVYNTYTDASNYERALMGWSANNLIFGQELSGTGQRRDIYFQGWKDLYFRSGSGATTRWQISDSGGHFLAFADSLYDIGASGANRPRNLYVGTSIFCESDINGARDVYCGNNRYYRFNVNGTTGLSSSGAGILTMADLGATNTTPRITLGGTTSAFPAIKRNGTGIDIRLADDSAFAPLSSGAINSNSSISAGGGSYIMWSNGTSSRMLAPSDGVIQLTNAATTGFTRLELGTANLGISRGTGTPEGVVTALVGSLYLRTDGGASTTLYVKESGTGNTGWVAK